MEEEGISIKVIATIEDVNQVFLWEDVFGKLIPKPEEASRVVYVKSEWYVNLYNYIRMQPAEYDRRTFWNPQFIWMTEKEYVGIKYHVPSSYNTPKTFLDYFL